MNKKLILEIRVMIDEGEISSLSGPGGDVLLIPFGGTVTGKSFRGASVPAAWTCSG
jgi:ABC-type uncharacterized transport system YnjBCD ATPase subunit